MNQRQKRIIIIVIAVAAAAAAILIGVLLAWRSQKNEPENNNAVQKAAVPTEAPPAEPTKDPHEGMVRSTLTGQWIKKSKSKKRPFAIMINNIEYAFLNQKGTSKADIIYEALAEGGITRMLALYEDVKNVKEIGSVRSARHYYVQFAKEWDAIFCHFGHTKYAVKKMKKLHTQNLSGLSAIGPVVYARTRSLKPPHNVFTSGKKLRKGAKKLKYTLKRRKGKQAEHFTFNEEDQALSGGKKAKKITLPFSYYSTCQMKYNKKKKKYMKYEYGKKHIDRRNKKQLAFKNVIVQLVKESNIDHNGYQTMKLTAAGKGYYFTDGKCVKITWERDEKTNQMRYIGEDGNTLSLNPGKTYIAVFPKNRGKYIKYK